MCLVIWKTTMCTDNEFALFSSIRNDWIKIEQVTIISADSRIVTYFVGFGECVLCAWLDLTRKFESSLKLNLNPSMVVYPKTRAVFHIYLGFHY